MTDAFYNDILICHFSKSIFNISVTDEIVIARNLL